MLRMSTGFENADIIGEGGRVCEGTQIEVMVSSKYTANLCGYLLVMFISLLTIPFSGHRAPLSLVRAALTTERSPTPESSPPTAVKNLGNLPG